MGALGGAPPTLETCIPFSLNTLQTSFFLKFIFCAYPLSPYHPCLAIEGADFLCQMVEVVEDGVVGISRHAVHLAYRLGLPRGEYQQRSLCARLESFQLWFPVAAYRLFLKVPRSMHRSFMIRSPMLMPGVTIAVAPCITMRFHSMHSRR